MYHGAILHEYGFHVLSANIQDEGYLGHESCRGLVVGHCLYDAFLHAEGSLDEFFAVSRGATSQYFQNGFGVVCFFFQCGERTNHGSYWITQVEPVVGENDISRFRVNGHQFCGCGARVYAYDNGSFAWAQGFYGYLVVLLVFQPILIFLFIVEEGRQLTFPVRLQGGVELLAQGGNRGSSLGVFRLDGATQRWY